GDGVGVLEGSSLVFANEAFCKMSGFTEEELLSLPSFFDLFPAGDNKDLPKKILTRPKWRKAPERHAAVLAPKQGNPVCLELTVNQVLEDNESYLILLIRNLTEQRKLRESLKNQESQYQFLFQSNPNPMFIYDLDSLAILDVNEAAVEQYGFSLQEFLKMTM